MIEHLGRFWNYIRHPSCMPTPFRSRELAARVVIILVILLTGVVIYPSWIWPVIGVLTGVALVTHPVCFFFKKDHAPGRHWFGLVDRDQRPHPDHSRRTSS